MTQDSWIILADLPTLEFKPDYRGLIHNIFVGVSLILHATGRNLGMRILKLPSSGLLGYVKWTLRCLSTSDAAV